MEQKLAQLRKDFERERAERQRQFSSGSVPGRLWNTSSAQRPQVVKRSIVGRGNISLESSYRQAAWHKYQGSTACSPLSPQIPQDTSTVAKPAVPNLDITDGSIRVRNILNSSNQQRSSLECASAHDASSKLDRGEPATSTCKPRAQQCPAHQLRNGSFDEDESRRSFLAALQDWRRGGRSPTAGSSRASVGATSHTVMTEPLPNTITRTNSSPCSIFKRIVLQRGVQAAGRAAAKHCRRQLCARENNDMNQIGSAGTTVTKAGTYKPSCLKVLDTREGCEDAGDVREVEGKQPEATFATGSLENLQTVSSHTGHNLNALARGSSTSHADLRNLVCDTNSLSDALPRVRRDDEWLVAKAKSALNDSEMSEGENWGVCVLSIQDADPMETLTSKIRLPDAIILPGCDI
jgi:hypothetical protein